MTINIIIDATILSMPIDLVLGASANPWIVKNTKSGKKMTKTDVGYLYIINYI